MEQEAAHVLNALKRTRMQGGAHANHNVDSGGGGWGGTGTLTQIWPLAQGKKKEQEKQNLVRSQCV